MRALAVRAASAPIEMSDAWESRKTHVGSTPVNSYTTAPVVSCMTSNMLITLMLFVIREGGFSIYNIRVNDCIN